MKTRLACLLVLAVLATPAIAQPSYVTSWPTADIPLGLGLASNGLLYVSSQSGGSTKAHVYNSSGVEVGQVGGVSPEIYGVGFLGNGNLVLAQYYFSKLDVYTPAGTLVTSWTIAASAAGFLAVDGGDNVYVSDGPGDRVRKVDNTGQVVASWPVTHPAGVAYSNGKVYVAGQFNQTMSVFLPDGTPVGSFPTGLTRAEQVCVDASGNLLVADWDAYQLRAFSPGGTLLWVLGPNIPGYGANPCRFTSVIAAPDGTIYAGDFDHDRVVVLKEQPTPAEPSTWGKVKDHYRR